MGLAFIVYTGMIWHVSGTYATASLVKAELERTQSNNTLAKNITQKLEDTQAKAREESKKQTKELFDELLKDPRYKSCRITDGVRDSIQRKLDSQPD
jgi:hypothetical protein